MGVVEPKTKKPRQMPRLEWVQQAGADLRLGIDSFLAPDFRHWQPAETSASACAFTCIKQKAPLGGGASLKCRFIQKASGALKLDRLLKAALLR